MINNVGPSSANRHQKLFYRLFVIIMVLEHSETIKNEFLVKFCIDIGPNASLKKIHRCHFVSFEENRSVSFGL